MTDDRTSRFRKAGATIDLRLGDLLGELGHALTEMMGRLETGGSQEIRRDYTIETGKGPLRAETGIRVRVAGAAAPSARPQPVNRPRAAASRPAPEPAAPPSSPPSSPPSPPQPIAAEIFLEADQWQLVADLPGVPREALVLARDGGDLVISAEGRGRRFHGRFALPAGLELEAIGVSLRNGILELAADLPGEAP